MTTKISVVIAAFNEEKLLRRCLTSLQKQSYPKANYEIIVVDNGSNDKTFQIAKEYPIEVYRFTDLQGCGASRKFGVSKAKGSLIAITDADSVVPPDWLKKVDQALQVDGVVAVGGPAFPDKKNVFTRCLFLFYNFFFLINNFFGKPILWGFNMAVKRAAYDEIGGINEELSGSEDWEFLIRLKKRYGSKAIVYSQNLRVTTSTRKQSDVKVFLRYSKDGLRNYIDIFILNKIKSIPIFNVR